MSMYTSLDRFRIKPGKEDLAREWFRYLNDHLAEANATMPAEGAHIESWFLHEESDGLYGYVYVIYDDNDKAVEVFKESENPLDIKHNEYMNACIDYHDYAEMKPAVAPTPASASRSATTASSKQACTSPPVPRSPSGTRPKPPPANRWTSSRAPI